ncbi:MAG: hypothetical protein HKP51_01750 [Sulfitobacter sp.]|nr:hypothetical protein [Sulfitobacter sp.]
MAYSELSGPAQVLSREITLTRNALAAIGNGFSRMMYAMAENSSMNARVKKVRYLQSKTDAELAALKIRREDIVRSVFGDLYYL